MKSSNILLFCLLILSITITKTNAVLLQGDNLGAHDPSRIIKCGNTFYSYCTGPNIPMRYSLDLIHWKQGKSVFNEQFPIPASIRKHAPMNMGDSLWAPDIIEVNKTFYLYYSFSAFGKDTSAIGLLTNKSLDPESPDYKWIDKGEVVTSPNPEKSNAIDPAPVLDADGHLWLCYGSFFSGLWIVPLDEKTGLIGSNHAVPTNLVKIQSEASYIHLHNGYYYLFINIGSCCRGISSTYHIIVGRSKVITGPYTDKDGRDLINGGGTIFLEVRRNQFGPGHMGVFSEDNIDRFTYHYYDADNIGMPTLGMQTLIWGDDGWPVAGDDIQNGAYKIVSKKSGFAFSLLNKSRANGTTINQSEYTDKREQKWWICSIGDGYYRISSLFAGKVICINDCQKENGTKITIFPWFNNDCQRWSIDQTSDGAYRIKSMVGGVIGIDDDEKADAIVKEWTWKNTDTQKWTITFVESK